MDEMEVYKRAAEMEKANTDAKEFIKKKKIQSQKEMAGMTDIAMTSLFQMLTHDDPTVRLKALTLWMSKMVPNIAPERVEDDKEVIEAGAGFEDIAAQIAELKKKAS